MVGKLEECSVNLLNLDSRKSIQTGGQSGCPLLIQSFWRIKLDLNQRTRQMCIILNNTKRVR